MPAASAGNSAAFREVSGNIVLSNAKTTLRVPYLLVPRALSDVKAALATPSFGTPVSATVTNPAGMIPGTADFYQWGLQDGDDIDEAVLGGAGYDMRAVGVQSFDFTGGDKLLVFAISTHDRWSNGAVNEFDILVDTGGQPGPEYAVVGVDFGAITADSFNGQVGAFVFDLRNGGAVIQFLAQAPTDSSTMLLPVLASDLGLTQQKRQLHLLGGELLARGRRRGSDAWHSRVQPVVAGCDERTVRHRGPRRNRPGQCHVRPQCVARTVAARRHGRQPRQRERRCRGDVAGRASRPLT